MMNKSEMQALIADEAAHEYFWEEYNRARARADAATLRRLELLCDALAILKLRRAGLDARRLIGALTKDAQYNHEHLGEAVNEGNYPTLVERRAFNQAALAWATPGAATRCE